jgi:predicted nucleic acid-binding protein
MSRAYLDTNFLYGLLRQPDGDAGAGFMAWRRRVEEEVADDAALVSGLVVDELVYRLVLAWLRDGGDPDPLTTFRRSAGAVMRRARARLRALRRTLERLELDIAPTDGILVDQAWDLMVARGLAPREAMHAAHAMQSGCEWTVSSDRSFDEVPGLRRLGPPPG